MEREFDAIVSALGARLLEIPEARLREARALVDADPDRSLIDTLSEIGALGPEERTMFEALSAEFYRHDATTLTGPPPSGAALVDLGRMRDAADQLRESGARYTVRGEHARGGMGRIFRVWDRQMHREVALKEVLPGDGDAGGRLVARFLREARITGRLQHPSIIPVHEIGVRDSGAFYYTMKLVRGRTLRQAIKESANLEGRLALLPHFVDLCQAMAYAHAHGVIHRDLKPSNVMIGEFGETQVIDWGLAKEVGRPEDAEVPESGMLQDRHEGESPDLTQAGQLLGTPHYMAPEQAAGRHDELDARSDVYSLGAVLYELLAGERPYRASTGPEALIMAAKEPPVPPESICRDAPPALVAICRRAMARKAENRYETACALAAEVLSFQAGQRVSAHEYSLAEVAALFIHRNRAAVLTACIGALLLFSLGIYAYMSLSARHAVEHDLRVRSEQRGYDMSIVLAQRALDDFRYREVQHLLKDGAPALRNWEWGRIARALREVRDPIAPDILDMVNLTLLPDGERALTLDAMSVVRIIDLDAGEVLRTITDTGGRAWRLALAPDGAEFALLLDEGGVKRWKTDTGTALPDLPNPNGGGDGIVYSGDGASLLVNAENGSVLEWSLANGEVRRTFPTNGGIVNDLAVSPDGRWLAAACASGHLVVWNWQSGEKVFVEMAHPDNRQIGTQGALCIEFSHDGALLATGGCDTQVQLWRVGSWERGHTLRSHLAKVREVHFSPDGESLMSISERVVRFWDLRTGSERPSWLRSDTNFRSARYGMGSDEIFTTSVDRPLMRWGLNAPRAGYFLTGHTQEVNSVRFSPDSRYLMSGAGHWLTGGETRALLWDLQGDGAGRSTPVSIREFPVAGHWVNQVAWSPEGGRVAAGDADGNVYIWDVATGRELVRLPVPEYTKGVRCVVYSPDGALLATAGWSAEPLPAITLWDSQTGARLRELAGAGSTIDSVAFRPDGLEVAAGCRDGEVHFWDVATGQHTRSHHFDQQWIYGVSYSPDGRWLAASCDSSLVLLVNPRTGEVRHRLEGLNLRANKVAFSPDGLRVASCDKRAVQVWNADTGAPLLTIPFGAQDVAFSPDGLMLAAAGFDGRVGLWIAEDWRENEDLDFPQ